MTIGEMCILALKAHKKERDGTVSREMLHGVAKGTCQLPSSMEPPPGTAINLDKSHKLTQP
jgi:hypothetical protein